MHATSISQGQPFLLSVPYKEVLVHSVSTTIRILLLDQDITMDKAFKNWIHTASCKISLRFLSPPLNPSLTFLFKKSIFMFTMSSLGDM